MNFNTNQSDGRIEQIVTLMEEVLSDHINEGTGTKLDEVENGLRELLHTVGQRTMAEFLTESDKPEPSIRCTCRRQARYRGRREGMVITIFGRVRYKRSYYVCDHCRRGEKPLDTRLGIDPGQMSSGLKPLVALLGIQTSFDEAAELVQKLLLLDVSDNSIRKAVRWVGQKQEAREQKWTELSDWHHYMNNPTREATPAPRRFYGSIDGVMVPTREEWRELKTLCWYEVSPLSNRQWPSRYNSRVGELEALKATDIRYHCDIADVDTFSKLLWSTGCHYLADQAQELIFVCDGAKWIWRLIDENFPSAVQILDWYHAVEYLMPIAHALFDQPDKQKAWVDTMKDHLWCSRTQIVIDRCRELDTHPVAAEPATKAATYFQNNLTRMDYAHFRRQGFFIGSGTVESGCKQISTMRLKRSGARWEEDGARWVAKARAAWLSGQWDDVVSNYSSLPLAV